MDYQWYPGHMTKARRMMQENIQLIDLLIELTDARAPQAGRNPDIDTLAKGKSRIVVLNKADLADADATKKWCGFFEEKGFLTAQIDSRKGSGVRQLKPLIDKACAEKIERNKRRGIVNRPVRAMIAGIPNVGKSTFINSFAGRAAAKTGDKPGVTKGKQWIRLNKNVELLDTPGILWPKFDDQEIGKKLALIGSIRDEITDAQELAVWLIRYLEKEYPDVLENRYQLSQTPGASLASAQTKEEDSAGGEDASEDSLTGIDASEDSLIGKDTLDDALIPGMAGDQDIDQAVRTLGQIALRRGCLKAGGEADPEKAAKTLIDDFRSGRLGTVTLEKV